MNWNDRFPCPLCGYEKDSIYHVAATCPHPAIVQARNAFRTSLANLVPRLARDLDDTRKRAKVDIPAAELTAEETSAIATIKSSLAASTPLTPHQELEVRLFSFRLLLAAPWSARNVMPGHHVASALGKLFDAITARDVSTNARRKVCNTMCLWAER